MHSYSTAVRRLGGTFMVLTGNLLYACASAMFILPAKIMSSGTTGIGLVLQQYTGVDIPVFIFIFNLLMLIIGRLVLGREFAARTLLSSLVYPFFLKLVLSLLQGRVLTQNLLLNVLFGGMGIGLSLGIVIRAGASTGGMDIPPLLLKQFFGIPVSVSLYCFDFLIVLSQLSFHPAEDLLYGILLLLATSITMNRVMLAGTSRTEVKIISEKHEEIRHAILAEVDRGVTVLHGEGGYRHRDCEVLLSVISNYELPRLERIVYAIDPSCFLIVSSVVEVKGKGFTGRKEYASPAE